MADPDPATPGRRTALDPRTSAAIVRAFDPRQADSSGDVHFEEHDPRFAARISETLRRLADEALWKHWRVLRNRNDATKIVSAATAKSAALTFVLSTSANGYVREAAVSAIDAVSGPFCLALLVSRLNDWVPNVRGAAEAKVAALSAYLDPRIIAGCIEYLWTFGDYGRASDDGRALVAVMINRDDVVAIVREWTSNNGDDRSVRLVNLLLQAGTIDNRLIALASQHKHRRVRAIAAKTALEGVFTWRARTLQRRSLTVHVDRLALALVLLRDRSIDVQAHALHYLAQNLPDETALDDILKRYLLHPRRKLADFALWKLGKRDVNWLGWLRTEFTVRPEDIAVARALGRFGVTSDGESLWVSSQRTAAPARLVFLIAAARLQHTDAIIAVREIALHGTDLARSRAAAAALIEAKAVIPTESLLNAAVNDKTFRTRGLLAHVRRHGALDQLNVFCALECAGLLPDGQEFARIERRLNRGKFEPSPSELEVLRVLVAGCPRVAGWVRRLQLL